MKLKLARLYRGAESIASEGLAFQLEGRACPYLSGSHSTLFFERLKIAETGCIT